MDKLEEKRMKNKTLIFLMVVFYGLSIYATYNITMYFYTGSLLKNAEYITGTPEIKYIQGTPETTRTASELSIKYVSPHRLTTDSVGAGSSTPAPIIWDTTIVDECGDMDMSMRAYGHIDSMFFDLKKDCIKSFRVDTVFSKQVDTLKILLQPDEQWYDNFPIGFASGSGVVILIILIL